MSSVSAKSFGISIAAIVIAAISVVIASASLSSVDMDDEEELEIYNPQTREMFLFTQVDEDIEEDAFEIPPDQFNPTQIIAKEGDRVKIHFFNLEPVETQEHHTFSMSAPYEMNYDVNAGEDVVIEFTATESGVFDYFCTYHQPTMRGQLIIID
jgi:plastocyanin